jgi:hypothetical protein
MWISFRGAGQLAMDALCTQIYKDSGRWNGPETLSAQMAFAKKIS